MIDIARKMVGGTGIEPVTTTMSMSAPSVNILKSLAQRASIFADCSRFTTTKSGQSRAKTGQVRHA